MQISWVSSSIVQRKRLFLGSFPCLHGQAKRQGCGATTAVIPAAGPVDPVARFDHLPPARVGGGWPHHQPCAIKKKLGPSNKRPGGGRRELRCLHGPLVGQYYALQNCLPAHSARPLHEGCVWVQFNKQTGALNVRECATSFLGISCNSGATTTLQERAYNGAEVGQWTIFIAAVTPVLAVNPIFPPTNIWTSPHVTTSQVRTSDRGADAAVIFFSLKYP